MNEEEKRERAKKYTATYRATHPDFVKKERKRERERQTIYRKSKKFKKGDSKRVTVYHKTIEGKEVVRKANAKYSKTEKGRTASRKGWDKHSKTEKGKKTLRKKEAKRRTLGFIELNEHFPNSDAHHIDQEFVIYIPTEMHRSVSHNVHTGKGMEQINNLAIDYCYGD